MALGRNLDLLYAKRALQPLSALQAQKLLFIQWLLLAVLEGPTISQELKPGVPICKADLLPSNTRSVL